jgi:large subunit ribosomal protein L29
MAKNNSKDFLASVSGLAVEDLKAKIAEDEMRLKKLSFAHSVTPVENPMTIRALRKDVARLKTVLRSKEIGLA